MPEPTDPYALWMRRLGRGLLLGGAVLVLLGVVGAVIAQAANIQANQLVHLQLEYFGVFAAISIFFLASAKYTLSRERPYLPLSLGFLGAAVFDLLHPLLPAGDIPGTTSGGFEFRLRDLNGYLWWMGRVSFGVGFVAAALALRQRFLDDQPARLLLRGLAWTVGEVALLSLLLVLLPLPHYYGADGVAAGLELLPILLFAAAGFLLFRPHVLIDNALRFVGGSSLSLAAAAQVFAALSGASGDALFVVAHVFKVASYLVVLFGLYFEHVNLYAQERRLRQIVEEAEREALRRRAELFAVIENTFDGIAILDRDGRVIHLNRAAERIFGKPGREKWVGTSLAEHVTGQEGRRLLANAVESTLEHGAGSRDIELQLPGAQSPQYVSFGVAPLRDASEQVQGAVVDIHDITNVRLAERRYRELTEGAPDGIIEMSRDGTIQFFNRAAEAIFGYPKEEVHGQAVRMLVPQRLPGTSLLDNGGRPLELTGLRKDGREIAIELTLSRRDGPDPDRLTAVVRDVQQLQRSRREKDALVAVARAVNASSEVRGLCAEAAPSLRDALRYEAVTLFVKPTARPVLEVLGAAGAEAGTEPPRVPGVRIGPDEASVVVRAFLSKTSLALSRDDPGAKSSPVPLRDDSIVLCVPVLAGPDAIGVVVGVTSTRRHDRDEELGVLQSVALQLALGISQKLLVQELQDTARSLSVTNRELDSFIYTASHDLAEPLRSMANFSQFLMEDYSKQLDVQGQDYLKRIHDGAIRMRSLLDALLQVSRIRHKPLPFETVDPKRLLRDVRDSLDAMIRERGSEVIITEPLPLVYAQPQRIIEVFSNLITNGLKFNESAKPRIEVSASEKDGFVEFRVRDNGIGIPEKYQDRVFGLFSRLHPRGKYPGTGAGLAIVRTIIEQHGGQIRIESKEGEGTSVIFTVPKEPLS
ncbi:MAG: PAS domain S-box protein [Euryarchaeota archaeon]|nr:PAS domain S-box protein [Euryarchaeota archaeon]